MRLATFLLLPGLLTAAELTLSGSLEEVTEAGICLKLSDGRRANLKLPRAGPLSAGGIVARYRLADQVEATIQAGKPYYDRQEGWLISGLKQPRFLRPAAPEELSKFLTLRPWRNPGNLLKPGARSSVPQPPDAAGPESPLDRARRVNLESVSRLPNFVVDEVARRAVRAAGSNEWQDVDTIESELSFQGTYTTRQQVRVNGKRWHRPLLPGPDWVTGFGELKPLFDPA